MGVFTSVRSARYATPHLALFRFCAEALSGTADN